MNVRAVGIAATFRAASAAALVSLLLPCSTLAQDKKRKEEEAKFRTVSGRVYDARDKLVSGAVVQLKNTKTLQVRSYITQEQGTYMFSGLDPDIDYTLKAEFKGAASAQRTLSSFDSRKKPVVNLKLEGK